MLSYTIFDTLCNNLGQDCELFTPAVISHISYNRLKNTTPVKSFFTTVTKNVTSVITVENPRIIIRIPCCDFEGIYHITRHDKYQLIY
jgi:hypothetical protein